MDECASIGKGDELREGIGAFGSAEECCMSALVADECCGGQCGRCAGAGAAERKVDRHDVVPSRDCSEKGTPVVELN